MHVRHGLCRKIRSAAKLEGRSRGAGLRPEAPCVGTSGPGGGAPEGAPKFRTDRLRNEPLMVGRVVPGKPPIPRSLYLQERDDVRRVELVARWKIDWK